MQKIVQFYSCNHVFTNMLMKIIYRKSYRFYTYMNIHFICTRYGFVYEPEAFIRDEFFTERKMP